MRYLITNHIFISNIIYTIFGNIFKGTPWNIFEMLIERNVIYLFTYLLPLYASSDVFPKLMSTCAIIKNKNWKSSDCRHMGGCLLFFICEKYLSRFLYQRGGKRWRIKEKHQRLLVTWVMIILVPCTWSEH